MGFISPGDFIDLYYKIRERGAPFILGKLSVNPASRTKNTWNDVDNNSSNWWIIEAVRKRWNKLATGNEELEYEDHVAAKYLSGKEGLSLLSIGCGEGDHEIKFTRYGNITTIKGIDMAAGPIQVANKKAVQQGFQKLSFENISFDRFVPAGKFDVILFNSSLHHFKDIAETLSKADGMLTDKGLVIIHEYTGPDMFQFGKERLDLLNQILNTIPPEFRLRLNSKSIKKKVYEPGRLRMYIADPSEACSSSAIMHCLHQQFNVIEEKKLGGDILHFVLKDIAHHFVPGNPEASSILQHLFKIEDEYITGKKYSDFMFGVYQKK